jgi:hypothetical protein
MTGAEVFLESVVVVCDTLLQLADKFIVLLQNENTSPYVVGGILLLCILLLIKELIRES